MPSLPRPRRTPQAPRESVEDKAFRLAVQLTPMQRHLVARAGLPRWLDLPLPFTPHPGRSLAAARVLASQEYGLLAPTLQDPLSYQLTLLGEMVASIWFIAAFSDPSDLTDLEPPTGPSFMPSPHR